MFRLYTQEDKKKI